MVLLNQFLDFETVNLVGYTDPITFSYNGTVAVANTYNMTVHLENEVSETTFQGTVSFNFTI